MKGVSEPIKNEAKEQKGGFLGMLVGTLGASLLVNLLKISKYKSIIKMNMFIQEISYLK